MKFDSVERYKEGARGACWRGGFHEVILDDGEQHTRAMWKRNAIYLVYRSSHDLSARRRLPPCSNGGTVVTVLGGRNCRCVKYYACGRKSECGQWEFSSSSVACEDKELVHANGKTYAFSDQMGR